jgi:hypothetical protein
MIEKYSRKKKQFQIKDVTFSSKNIYNLNGKKLKTLVDRFHTMGHYSLELTSHELNSGFYLVKIFYI